MSQSRSRAVLIALFCLQLLGCYRPTLGSMTAPPGSTGELGAGEHGGARAGLERTVRDYLKDGWAIQGSRYFLVDPRIGWNEVEKLRGNDIEQNGGTRVEFDWHDPGITLVAVWKVGWIAPDYLAAAMAREPVDGKVLVAYFALRRD